MARNGGLNELPPYVSPAEIGAACGWTRRKALRRMQKLGIAEFDGTRWQCSTDLIQARANPVHVRLFAHLCLQAKSDRARP